MAIQMLLMKNWQIGYLKTFNRYQLLRRVESIYEGLNQYLNIKQKMENMKNRVLVVPDVHGRTFWKEEVSKWLEDVDKVVFLGDYLDPYEYHLPDALFANLMEIIE